MTPAHCLGVDPGVKGALCLLEIQSRKIQVFDMPVTQGQVDGAKLATIVEVCLFQAGAQGLRAVVENVSSRPRQAHAFSFGRSTGVVHGVLDALGVPYELVSPAQWKPAMGLRRLATEDQAANKTKSRELAMKLFSEQADLFDRVRDDGRAEAALISFFYTQKKGWF